MSDYEKQKFAIGQKVFVVDGCEIHAASIDKIIISINEMYSRTQFGFDTKNYLVPEHTVFSTKEEAVESIISNIKREYLGIGK